jgi:hypothetical protein
VGTVAPTLQSDAEPSYDFHSQRSDVTADRGAARRHTNSLRSTNLEFRCRYLSHIRGRDGFMAPPSIRPTALKGRREATARLAPPQASSVVFDLKYRG